LSCYAVGLFCFFAALSYFCSFFLRCPHYCIHTPRSLSILYTMLLCPTPAARGTALKRSGCGSSNIRQGQVEDARCRLPEQHNVSLPDLLEQTEHWQVRIVSCLFLLKNMFAFKTTVTCLVLTYQLLVLIVIIVIIVITTAIVVASPCARIATTRCLSSSNATRCCVACPAWKCTTRTCSATRRWCCRYGVGRNTLC
jgi:hypothetical protein